MKKKYNIKLEKTWIEDAWECFQVLINGQRITVSVHIDTVTSPLERLLNAQTMAVRSYNRVWP